MFAAAGGGKAKRSLRIGIPVCKTACHQPVEDAIEGDAIEGQVTQGLFDLVVGQCGWCRSQQAQDANARRRGACARPANQEGRALGVGRLFASTVCCRLHGPELEHRSRPPATLLQLVGGAARSGVSFSLWRRPMATGSAAQGALRQHHEGSPRCGACRSSTGCRGWEPSARFPCRTQAVAPAFVRFVRQPAAASHDGSGLPAAAVLSTFSFCWRES